MDDKKKRRLCKFYELIEWYVIEQVPVREGFLNVKVNKRSVVVSVFNKGFVGTKRIRFREFKSIPELLDYVVVECITWLAELELKGNFDG